MSASTMRNRLMHGAAAALGLLILYRLWNPAESSLIGIATVIGVTAVLSVLWEHRHADTDIDEELPGWRMTLVTTMVSGLLVLLAVYAAAYGSMLAAYMLPTNAVMGDLLFELLQHLRLFQIFPLETVLAAYLVGATLLATGVWLLQPHVLIRQDRIRLIVTFLAAWIYALATASLLLPVVYSWAAAMLLVDAVFIIFWALTFINTLPTLEEHLDHR